MDKSDLASHNQCAKVKKKACHVDVESSRLLYVVVVGDGNKCRAGAK